MPIKATDPELERLQDKRDHLKIKLNLAEDSGVQDADQIRRLRRSLQMLEVALAERSRTVKITSGTTNASFR